MQAVLARSRTTNPAAEPARPLAMPPGFPARLKSLRGLLIGVLFVSGSVFLVMMLQWLLRERAAPRLRTASQQPTSSSVAKPASTTRLQPAAGRPVTTPKPGGGRALARPDQARAELPPPPSPPAVPIHSGPRHLRFNPTTWTAPPPRLPSRPQQQRLLAPSAARLTPVASEPAVGDEERTNLAKRMQQLQTPFLPDLPSLPPSFSEHKRMSSDPPQAWPQQSFDFSLLSVDAVGSPPLKRATPAATQPPN